MKKTISLLLICTMLFVLTACGEKAVSELSVDSTYTILHDASADASTVQAALCLQASLKKNGISLEIVTEAKDNGKHIQLLVDDSLNAGQYTTELSAQKIVIKAQSSLTLLMAIRNIAPAWTVDSGSVLVNEARCAASSGTIQADNAPFLVLSQNIRFADDPEENSILKRSRRFQQLVQEYQPDIISTQESTNPWVKIYQSFLGSSYSIASGYGQYGDFSPGTQNTILYRTDRYELVECDTFWLSETPKEYSKLQGSSGYRSCNWALLKDKLTEQTIFVCNIHLDTKSDEVKQQQLNIVWEQCEAYFTQYPTLFTGDFNATPQSPVYAQAAGRLSDPHVSAALVLSDLDYTYHGYFAARTSTSRLDYCFYGEALTANYYRIMSDQYEGFVSDHYGILTEFQFK